ncbi:DEAD/DEAH box helicase [Urechidicola croceus]|uniref:DEAD-box ATP-dependent RNA helicase RhpA n=1 Tax=Urechidicola croceus TaxID=1850246 RepID=A0A1D8P3Y7_9FLAO|nr:DEAD/DEAH box helicase [Urechidicola croceus]AOW19292.1 DEAD/DEAH box helicase [Urechidicola croceus]
MSTFKELGLKPEIVKALTDLGYENPTEIQEKAVPQVIASDQDLKAFAQTGTGKTAAFSLPILQKIDLNNNQVQAIILSPTRELAIQIARNIEEFSTHLKGFGVAAVYGGADISQQMRKLRKGVQIVVGTPGRTVDLIKRKSLRLDSVKWLVLDEADEMLNMGFKDELDQVLEVTPDSKQTLLFSATFPREVDRIARNYMNDPTQIDAGKRNSGSDNVTHEYYVVSDRNRYHALKRIADINPEIYGIIFCRTRRETQEVADKLIQDGYSADSLHGELSQAQRDIVMQKFRKKTLQILVATDVAARGLDVDNLTHVINYKLPDQIESYTHRSGRTGRANSTGISIAIVSPGERRKLSPIERKIGKSFVQKQVPEGKDILKIQLLKLIDKVKDIEVNESQINDFIPEIQEKLADLDRDELIKRFVSIEFNSFLSYYKNASDLNDISSSRRDRRDRDDSRGRRDNENMTRFFINIGRKDKLNPARLIGLINEQNITKNIEIGQIEILDTFSFFELDKNFTNETLAAFTRDSDVEFEGRGVNVEVTEKKRAGSRGGRRDGRKRRSDGGKNHRGANGDRRSKPSGPGSFNKGGFGRDRSDKGRRSKKD